MNTSLRDHCDIFIKRCEIALTYPNFYTYQLMEYKQMLQKMYDTNDFTEMSTVCKIVHDICNDVQKGKDGATFFKKRKLSEI